jgi:hypothetical protein
MTKVCESVNLTVASSGLLLAPLTVPIIFRHPSPAAIHKRDVLSVVLTVK